MRVQGAEHFVIMGPKVLTLLILSFLFLSRLKWTQTKIPEQNIFQLLKRYTSSVLYICLFQLSLINIPSWPRLAVAAFKAQMNQQIQVIGH